MEAKEMQIPTSVAVDVVAPLVDVVRRLLLVMSLMCLLDYFILDCSSGENSFKRQHKQQRKTGERSNTGKDYKN